MIISNLTAVRNNTVRNGKLMEDAMALQQLLKLFGNESFLPLTRWSVSPREMLHVCNEITINNRESIVEFGAGFSTICMAQLIKITGSRARLVSVENDPVWCAEVNKILSLHNLSGYVTLIHVPITDVRPEIAAQGQTKWYDAAILTEALSSVKPIDLVLVDAPFSGTSVNARYSALPFLSDKLSGSVAVFLDDTYRESEMAMATAWSRDFNLELFTNGRYCYLTRGEKYLSEPFGLKHFIFK